MKVRDLDKALTLKRRHSDLIRCQTSLNNSHDAYITIRAPRSGPGNDRDELSIEIPIEAAKPFLAKAIKDIEQQLEDLGLEL